MFSKCCKRCEERNNYKLIKYSNGQRIHETKQFIYRRKMDKYKIANNITELEMQLNGFNGKSCIPNTFMAYVKKKTELSVELLNKYSVKLFRQLKWYFYINKQRSEAKLVNKLKKTYGEDSIIVCGDWSISKHMRNYMPTPMIGFKRMLRKHFDVLNIDEYNTSKYNNKTKEENENLSLLTRPKKKRKKKDIELDNSSSTQLVVRLLHSVLTYKMENGRLGCINRDLNAVLNMKEITEYWFKSKKRHPTFDRKSK